MAQHQRVILFTNDVVRAKSSSWLLQASTLVPQLHPRRHGLRQTAAAAADGKEENSLTAFAQLRRLSTMTDYKGRNVRLNGFLDIKQLLHEKRQTRYFSDNSLNPSNPSDPSSTSSPSSPSDSSSMADGLNNARAMRIVETVTQYQNFLQQIAASQVNVPPAQAQARGYVLLRQYHQQAQALSASTFNTNIANNPKNDEATKRQLQRVMLDAQARRFKAYKLVSLVACCMRWVNRRAQLLKGQQPGPQHSAALAQIDAVLQQEMTSYTNQRLYNDLRARDTAAGYWMAEMAPLNTLLAYIQANQPESSND